MLHNYMLPLPVFNIRLESRRKGAALCRGVYLLQQFRTKYESWSKHTAVILLYDTVVLLL